jgi:hypothetical protein
MTHLSAFQVESKSAGSVRTMAGFPQFGHGVMVISLVEADIRPPGAHLVLGAPSPFPCLSENANDSVVELMGIEPTASRVRF